MWTDLVVVLPPGLDDRCCLPSGSEPFHAEALVAQLSVEALVGAVLPGFAGSDVGCLDAGAQHPTQDRGRHELRSVVRSEISRSASNADQSGQDVDHPAGSNASGDVDRQCLACPLVDDRQAFDLLPVGRGVEYEVVVTCLGFSDQ